jgi:hypothetical protein
MNNFKQLKFLKYILGTMVHWNWLCRMGILVIVIATISCRMGILVIVTATISCRIGILVIITATISESFWIICISRRILEGGTIQSLAFLLLIFSL